MTIGILKHVLFNMAGGNREKLGETPDKELKLDSQKITLQQL
jgi:hypothetical protein